MDKVININLAGRLISINENAYVILDQYLGSLKQYFLKEEGGEEILHDMEDRIGELFQEKLKKGKTSISKEDVDAVMNIMGSPQQILEETNEESGSQQYKTTENVKEEPVKRLKRSAKEKVIGGVCGGIAAHFNIDPAIVRIIFVFVTLAWGAGVLIYLLLWALLPLAQAEPVTLRRRLYRNTDQKVMGGVCSGLGAYLRVDPIWLRLLFILPILGSLFFGLFDHNFWPFSLGGMPSMVLLYLILWIAVPKAQTLTEKLEMKGQKVDVESLSNAVKQKEASGSPVLSKENSVLLTLLKIFVFFIGSILLVTVFSLIGALFFAFFKTDSAHLFWNYNALFFGNAAQKWVVFIAFLILLMLPIYVVVRLMIHIISGKKPKSQRWLNITLVILFLGSIFILFGFSASIIRDFKTHYFKKEMVNLQPIMSDTLYLSSEPTPLEGSQEGLLQLWKDSDQFFSLKGNQQLAVQNVSFQLLKSKDSAFHVEIEKSSFGRNEQMAKSLTLPIQYQIEQKGNRLYIPKDLFISPTQPFRWQAVKLNIYIPDGKVFHLNGLNDSYVSEKSYSYKSGRFKIRSERSARYNEDGFYRMDAAGETQEIVPDLEMEEEN